MVAELQDELQELQNEMETLRQQLKEKSTSLVRECFPCQFLFFVRSFTSLVLFPFAASNSDQILRGTDSGTHCTQGKSLVLSSVCGRMCVQVCLCTFHCLTLCICLCPSQLKQLEEEVEEYERLTRELKSTLIEKDKRVQVPCLYVQEALCTSMSLYPCTCHLLPGTGAGVTTGNQQNGCHGNRPRPANGVPYRPD